TDMRNVPLRHESGIQYTWSCTECNLRAALCGAETAACGFGELPACAEAVLCWSDWNSNCTNPNPCSIAPPCPFPPCGPVSCTQDYQCCALCYCSGGTCVSLGPGECVVSSQCGSGRFCISPQCITCCGGGGSGDLPEQRGSYY